MKAKILKFIGFIFITCGIVLCVYVLMARVMSNKNVLETINKFEIEKNNNEDTLINQLYNEFQTYNEYLYVNGQQLVDAFSYENSDFDLKQYGFSDNVIGYIDIPKMQITLPIYLGATKEYLNKGATLLSQTSIPIGGKNTNAVVAAHRGLVSNKMFRDIQLLEIGDEIKITNAWEELTYVVDEIKIIEPDDIKEILIQDNRDLVTLVTCHPFRVNTQRYVVICERKI